MLDIPENFQSHLLQGKPEAVQFQVDTSNTVLGTLATVMPRKLLPVSVRILSSKRTGLEYRTNGSASRHPESLSRALQP